MFELLLFLSGLIFGSFLNVCICRLPKDESVISPPPCCPHCRSRLAPIDLIPVVSYFLLRGRCRRCGAAFSARYAVVELVTGGLFVWCYAVFGLGAELFKALVLACFLVVITFIDYDHQLILNKVLLWLAGAGVAINLAFFYLPLWDSFFTLPSGPLAMLAGALTGGLVMLVVFIVSRGGMGAGDVKFAAALGLWLGWQHTLLTLFLSFLFGGAGGAALLVLRLKGRKDMIPFGPFIAAGAFIALLYGPALMSWYLR